MKQRKKSLTGAKAQKSKGAVQKAQAGAKPQRRNAEIQTEIGTQKKLPISKLKSKNTNPKISITIDIELQQALNHAKNMLGISRNEAAEEAITMWLESKKETLEQLNKANGYLPTHLPS